MSNCSWESQIHLLPRHSSTLSIGIMVSLGIVLTRALEQCDQLFRTRIHASINLKAGPSCRDFPHQCCHRKEDFSFLPGTLFSSQVSEESLNKMFFLYSSQLPPCPVCFPSQKMNIHTSQHFISQRNIISDHRCIKLVLVRSAQCSKTRYFYNLTRGSWNLKVSP